MSVISVAAYRDDLAFTLRGSNRKPEEAALAQRGVGAYTLTSGTFGTEPRGEEPPPFGPDGLRRGLRRLRFASGIFSGLGVTGPSRYSKPSFSKPASSFTVTTRTWPPPLSLPNRTSSASAFLMFS